MYCTVLWHRERARVKPERRLEGQEFTKRVGNPNMTNYTQEIGYLQSTISYKHLPKSPFLVTASLFTGNSTLYINTSFFSLLSFMPHIERKLTNAIHLVMNIYRLGL
jgi:hypothetical protein